ncbi:GntR family transcriptional regulator [Kluyvera sp. STS39-E]|uniref:GntR family transcriptional regulator n=1 Tax=Kluyvera sp. STS39-E TaxID=3234748 RepID=UPI0034C5CC0F
MLDFAKAQRISLTQQVENNIKNALIIGALKPGERLVTREIAVNQGISITPVREALLRLVSSGALRAAPAQAFMVTVLTKSGYREISQIRKNLEGMATATASGKITADKIGELNDLSSLFHEAKTAGDITKMLQANYQFRFKIYAYAEMPTLMTMIEQLWVRAGPSFHYLYNHSIEPFQHINLYQPLLTALEKKEPSASHMAICQVIDESASFLQQQYQH